MITRRQFIKKGLLATAVGTFAPKIIGEIVIKSSPKVIPTGLLTENFGTLFDARFKTIFYEEYYRKKGAILCDRSKNDFAV